MKSKTGKKLIFTLIWAMQWILMAGAIVAFTEFGTKGKMINLFSGCFLFFYSVYAHYLRGIFKIELAKGVRDAANRDWLAKQNRRTRRKYGIRRKKPVSKTILIRE